MRIAVQDSQAVTKPQAGLSEKTEVTTQGRGSCAVLLSKSPLEEMRVQGADGWLLTELLGKWEAFLHEGSVIETRQCWVRAPLWTS